MTAIRCHRRSSLLKPLDISLSLSLFLFPPVLLAVFDHPAHHRVPSSRTLALNCLGVAGASLVGRVMGLRVPWRGGIFGLATVSNSGYLRACVSTIRLMIPNALSARDSPPRRHILPRNLGHPPSPMRRSFCERFNVAIRDGRAVLNGADETRPSSLN